MSHLTHEELSILRKYQKEIRYMPTRETVKKFHKWNYTPWTLNGPDPKKKESKRREKTDDGYEILGHGYKGFMMAHLLKPSHSGLTLEELERAQLTRASRTYYRDGLGAAEQYLLQKNSPYKIDGELSNSEGLVLINKNGKPEIAYRGTDKFNLEDIKTDAAILFGKERETKQFKEADEQVQNVKEKYGIIPEHFQGFSLGASKSLHAGQLYNRPSTNFNPFMGKNLTNNISTTNELQTVIRTTEDPISLGLALSDNATHDSWRVKSILPLKPNSLNPIESHNLENFTNENNLERGTGTAYDLMAKNVNIGKRLAETEDLNSAINSVEKGETYSEWLRNTQKSVNDTYIKGSGEIGLKGTRHRPSARGMRAWHDAGGSFTGDEAQYINTLMSGKTPPTPREEPTEILGGGDMVQGVPNIGPEEPKSQKFQSKFRGEKTSSPLLPETKLRMHIARGGLPEIQEDGTVTGLSGERKFIPVEKREDYNRMRELFNKGLGVAKEQAQTYKEGEKIRTRMRGITEQPILETPPSMSEDELNQRNDIIDKAIINEHKDNKDGLTEAERQSFVLEDKEGRDNMIEDATHEFNESGKLEAKLLEPMKAAGLGEQITRAGHPTNLAVGFIAGSATEKIAKATGIDKMPMIPKDLLKGSIMGGMTEKISSGLTGAALTKAGMGMNMAGGAASYLVGDAVGMGAKEVFQKAGATKDETELGVDLWSGAASGATYGAFLGGGEGALLGTAVGTLGGAASFGAEKLGASSETAGKIETALDVGLAGAGVGATIGSIVPGIGTAVGAVAGGVIAEGGYWLSKLF